MYVSEPLSVSPLKRVIQQLVRMCVFLCISRARRSPLKSVGVHNNVSAVLGVIFSIIYHFYYACIWCNLCETDG
jgi:hypothetical protein